MSAIEKVQHQAVTLAQYLGQRRDALAEIVPKHLNVDRLLKVALNCVSKTPALKECSMASVLQCVTTCAELGLEPGGALGGAYLVPYKGVCTLIVGYRGMVDLMRRSGQLSTLRAVVVRQKDRFRYTEGLEPTLEHEPFLDGEAGPLRFVYVVAKLKDGSLHVEVMSRSQVDAIKNRSRASGSGPWQTDYEEMARKTVVRRAAKLLPMSADLAHAIEAEDDIVDGEVVHQSAAVLDSPSPAEVALKKKARLAIKDVPSKQPTPPQAVTSTGEPPPDLALPGDGPPPLGDEDFRGGF